MHRVLVPLRNTTTAAAVDSGLSLGTLLLRVALVVAPFLAGYLLYSLAMEAVKRRERREAGASQAAGAV
ncbi:hypothetical protein ACFO0N_09415 [Halobium salinum]|uniref:Uncharacterized protein n=1 Tax=Halobium salinum TaxID=1364940 RepID=A0ABD5PBB3_9EURY|nr:hypothetical protein [Halobium salinum]